VAISDTNGKGKAKEVFDDDYPEADTFDDVDMHFDDIDDFGLAAEVTEQKPITKEEKMDIDWKTTKPTVNGFHPKKDEDSKTEPLAWLSLHASLLTSAAASTPEDALASSAAGSVNSGSKVDALESDGSLRMYWLDYLELEGKVYFVGKVLDKTDASKKKWVSCCVTVEGIQRNLFVLPRDKRFGMFSLPFSVSSSYFD
jgi:DNA polymerase alpha subunit A